MPDDKKNLAVLNTRQHTRGIAAEFSEWNRGHASPMCTALYTPVITLSTHGMIRQRQGCAARNPWRDSWLLHEACRGWRVSTSRLLGVFIFPLLVRTFPGHLAVFIRAFAMHQLLSVFERIGDVENVNRVPGNGVVLQVLDEGIVVIHDDSVRCS